MGDVPNPTTSALHLCNKSLHCLFFENLRFKEEVINVHSQDTIVIIIGLYNIFRDNNLLERIINLSEWSDFLRAFRFIRQRIRRLDIVSGGTKIAYKIYFQLFSIHFAVLIFLTLENISYIPSLDKGIHAPCQERVRLFEFQSDLISLEPMSILRFRNCLKYSRLIIGMKKRFKVVITQKFPTLF